MMSQPRSTAKAMPAASALTTPRLSSVSHRQRLACLKVHGMGLPAVDIDRLVEIGRRHLRLAGRGQEHQGDGNGNGLRDHSIDPRYRLSIAEPVM
jgi:hypothetical protein